MSNKENGFCQNEVHISKTIVYSFNQHKGVV